MIATTECTPANVIAFGYERAEKETHSIVEVGGVKFYRIETCYGRSTQVPLEDLVQAYAFVRSQDSLALNIAITFLDIKKCQKYGWSPELVWVLNTFRWYVFYKEMSHLVKPAAKIIEDLAKEMHKSPVKNIRMKQES